MTIIDSESIKTAAGIYTLDYIHDENADQPYNWEGFTLITEGGRDYINIREGDTRSNVSLAVQAALRGHARNAALEARPWEIRSGAAIVRYLRLSGKRGVTLVDDRYRPVEPTADRYETPRGVAWAPDEAIDPDEYTRQALAEWTAWAEGETFGWRLSDPSGDEVESVWGYFGFDRERQHILKEARSIARDDAECRLNEANLSGAGFIGLI